MNIDEKMQEMRRRMEERNAQIQEKMNNLMRGHGINNPAGYPPPTMPTFTPPVPGSSPQEISTFIPPIPGNTPPAAPTNNTEESQFCPECGTKCDARAKFCMQCGARLNAENTTQTMAGAAEPVNNNLPECPIDFEDFEDCGFRYRYEVDGEEKVLEVIFESCPFFDEDEDDEESYSLCWCIDGEAVDIDDEDMRGCEDIHDCGVAIAKKLNFQHDDKVMMSFGQDEKTFTDVTYEICLDKNFNYCNDNKETVMLSLSADQGHSVVQTMFYEIDEEAFDDVKEAFENEDTDEIWSYLDSDFYCNETLNLWGDEEVERLGYDIEDSDGETIDDGDIHVAEQNVFNYCDSEEDYAVSEDFHPQYIVMTTETVKRAYTTFEMPADFNIGGISFIKCENAKWDILPCDETGDTVTSIQKIRYAGKTYYSEDMGDAGTYGDLCYFLYEWNEENCRYDLVAKC